MKLQAKKAGKQFIRRREDGNIFWAVKDEELALTGGRFMAVYGPSGSGKSTLLAMLAGILKPTEGQILLDDVDLYSMPDGKQAEFRTKHISMIPQGQTAVQSLNVLENVLLSCYFRKDLKGQEETLKKRAEELLKILKIDSLKAVMPREMSGGELRRMAVARALLPEPDVVLADEPTADLDDVNTKIVLECLKQTAKSNKAVLVVTHDPKVMEYADEVVNMVPVSGT